jgi:hypothetical protein
MIDFGYKEAIAHYNVPDIKLNTKTAKYDDLELTADDFFISFNQYKSLDRVNIEVEDYTVKFSP